MKDNNAPEKILFVAYQFPPMGGPGVQRSFQLVRRLPQEGITPVVLTIDEASIARGRFVRDESLMKLLPADVLIYRAPSYEPTTLTALFMRFRMYRVIWFLFYPFLWERSARWPYRVFSNAKRIVAEHGISVVYTTSGPFSSLILGRMLQKRLGLKWVADLRDPFTDGYAWDFPSKLHWRIMRVFERRILERPDSLIVNTEAVRKLFRERKIRTGKPIEVINNGF